MRPLKKLFQRSLKLFVWDEGLNLDKKVLFLFKSIKKRENLIKKKKREKGVKRMVQEQKGRGDGDLKGFLF